MTSNNSARSLWSQECGLLRPTADCRRLRFHLATQDRKITGTCPTLKKIDDENRKQFTANPFSSIQLPTSKTTGIVPFINIITIIIMAPDADKLRQRVPVKSLGNDDEQSEEKVTTIKSLQSNEVVIDGVIYDITSFQHPGGDSIHIFGGNDATVAYKMIHPYHTKKQLEKMKRIGVVPDYRCEYVW